MDKKRLRHIEKLKEVRSDLEYLTFKSKYRELSEEDYSRYKTLKELEDKLYAMIKFESYEELKYHLG